MPPIASVSSIFLKMTGFGQQVRLAAVAGAPVEGAEVAVGDADVRVVDVAVDDEGDRVGVGAPGTELVGRAARPRQVARLEQRNGVVVGDALALERAVEDRAHPSV